VLLFLLGISNEQGNGGVFWLTGIGLNIGFVGCILSTRVGYILKMAVSEK